MKNHLLPILLGSLLLACNSEAPTAANESAIQNETEMKSTTNIEKPSAAFIGTYTRKEGHVDGQADGIYQFSLEGEEWQQQKTVASIINPSFVVASPDGSYLYAVSELAQEHEPNGFVYAYRIGADSLQLLNRLSTGGRAPCHLSFDREARYIFVANYLDGVVQMYRRNDDGSLSLSDSINPQTATGETVARESNLHSVKVSPDNRLAFIADKGTDKVWIYEMDHAAGKLMPFAQPYVEVQRGAGPRHLAWSADGRFCYVINELDNTINVIAHDAVSDRFQSVQSISTLPKGYTAASACADLHLHPNGRFLYGSNRGHDSIAMLAIDADTGLLTSLGQEATRGVFPRNFAIDPFGK